MKQHTLATTVALLAMLGGNPTLAASDAEISALKAEMARLKAKIEKLEKERVEPIPAPAPAAVSSPNSFNPSIGVILNGQYRAFSEVEGDIAGFAVGHEGERGEEGFSVEHTELNVAASVDDKFSGSVTAALAEHNGETEVELEEAFVQTLPGMGLPRGMSANAGRAFWTLGYLNEHHPHADDFADRPLPYRVFLDGNFNDDGAEISYVLPTDFYSEVGGGIFRGDDYPFGSASGSSPGAWSAFARVGGDIGDNQDWRVGSYILSGDANGRLSNEDAIGFTGDSNLYAADLRYTWAPTGNSREQEVLLQGEYFWRNEDGSYEDTAAGTGVVGFDDHASGWYAQGVYKFLPEWRIGARYSRLNAPDTPAGLAGSTLDSSDHDPQAWALMGDWTNSEFSRVRVQYNREELASQQDDNQILVQYIMSLGAHGAHKY